MSLEPLRARGLNTVADAVVADLQALTAKRLTAKYPSLSAADAIAHLATVRDLLRQVATAAD
jgi:predicted lysophospholipase L1 biosynthesis ABC-type transport system permease subunit